MKKSSLQDNQMKNLIIMLLKAELRYNSFVHVMLFLMLLFTFHMFATLVSQSISYDPSIPRLISAAVMILLFTNRFLEKRTRLFHLLPLTLKQMGFTRLLFQVVYYGGAILLYGLSMLYYATLISAALIIYRLCALSSLLIMTNAAISISYDIWTDSNSNNNISKYLLTGTMWLFLLLFATLYIESFIHHLFRSQNVSAILLLYFSPLGVLFQHLIAFMFSLASWKIFIKREKYLD